MNGFIRKKTNHLVQNGDIQTKIFETVIELCNQWKRTMAFNIKKWVKGFNVK